MCNGHSGPYNPADETPLPNPRAGHPRDGVSCGRDPTAASCSRATWIVEIRSIGPGRPPRSQNEGTARNDEESPLPEGAVCAYNGDTSHNRSKLSARGSAVKLHDSVERILRQKGAEVTPSAPTRPSTRRSRCWRKGMSEPFSSWPATISSGSCPSEITSAR